MRAQVRLGQRVKGIFAQRRGQLGKVLAQGVDLPPEEHVGIDGNALCRRQLWSALKEEGRVVLLRSGAARRQLPEGTLCLGEFHRARTSRSICPAL